jgi:hypothetical protein
MGDREETRSRFDVAEIKPDANVLMAGEGSLGRGFVRLIVERITNS